MLRADMDALPYASKIEGVFQVCGHDLHVAWLMGASRLFSELN
jgi:metal-dependent amidase/aminoacylase/carboxypeptidase family protein